VTMRTVKTLGVLLAASAGFLVGCNKDGPPAKDPITGQVKKTPSGTVLTEQAAKEFGAAADEMKKHDAASDWTDAACESTAKAFQEAAAQVSGATFEEAIYDSGVSYQRCKNDAKAKAIFSDLLAKNPKYHRARVQMALYSFVEGGAKDVEKAIAELQQAVSDAEFKNEEALVHLALMQMIRDNDVKDDDGDNDFDRAKGNLQRALAINDGFMPAFNQLAIYYLESAKKKAMAAEKKSANSKMRRRGVAAAVEVKKKADTQALELAQLVCSQAIRKNPKYAPVYNTIGLIYSELGDLSQAAASFGTARKLDAKFFEAHMNYAAVNLTFRGFDEAAKAYKDAIALRPNDYEAHLGLALAYRGAINDTNFDQMLAESQKELAAAKSIDADRAETYYNEAILVEEYKTKTLEGEKAEPVYLAAKDEFKLFIDKAGNKEEYADAVKRATERMKEIDEIIQVIHDIAEAAKHPPPPPPPAPPPAGADAGAPPADPNAPAPPPADAPPPPAQ
jgi:Tfp pilus assembly protein PilF